MESIGNRLIKIEHKEYRKALEFYSQTWEEARYRYRTVHGEEAEGNTLEEDNGSLARRLLGRE